jgi:hypothetical protein
MFPCCQSLPACILAGFVFGTHSADDSEGRIYVDYWTLPEGDTSFRSLSGTCQYSQASASGEASGAYRGLLVQRSNEPVIGLQPGVANPHYARWLHCSTGRRASFARLSCPPGTAMSRQRCRDSVTCSRCLRPAASGRDRGGRKAPVRRCPRIFRLCGRPEWPCVTSP